MINAFLSVPVVVPAGTNIQFPNSRARTNGSCYCNGGWLTHSDGSGQFLINRPGIYMVSVGIQATSATAGDVATFAITTNGEALAGTTMAETITAAGDVAQLATTALLTVPCNASFTVGVENVGGADVTVNAASLVLTRVA